MLTVTRGSTPLLELTITEIRALTLSIRAFKLSAPAAMSLPPFSAGAHIEVIVTLADGDDATRSYSLVNSLDQGSHYEIAVLLDREGDGGSVFMHSLREGDALRTSAPVNRFPLEVSARRNILIAGGIGVTPILAMARELAGRTADFALHYCARDQASMAYREELAQVCGGAASFYFDGGDPARGVDFPAVLAAPDSATHIFVCGPAGMIERALDTAKQLDWPRANVHFELFNQTLAGMRSFEVELSRSGETLTVGANESIIEALTAAGYDPVFDCKRGECGVCAVAVLEGEPEHRDYNLSDSEKASGDIMCICVSRSKSARLVLDL